MGSKNFLNVAITPRSTLAENNQKSCESYDSTSSNYSQVSEISDMSINSVKTNNVQKPHSSNSIHEDSMHFTFSSNEAQVKRTIWQKAVASFRGYKDKKIGLMSHRSVSSPNHSPTVSECPEMDPVYHLLKCAAGQKKCDKCVSSDISKRNNVILLEREKSLPGIHLDVYKGACNDPTCPCNEPDKLPVVKKEDLGQQAKRQQSIKKSTSVSPRLQTITARSCSVSESRSHKYS